jgi:hypothetical protein
MNNDIIHPSVKMEESLDNRFARERLEWSQKIDEISKQLKQVLGIPELMTTLYTDRQRAVEYYHYLISLLISMNKTYNKAYAEKYDYYTHKVQVRYPNESIKNNRILTDLGDMIEKREMVNNHSKFILSSIQTIDNVIYAIPRRIEIENIARGK